MTGTRQGTHTEGVRTMTRFNTQRVHGLPVNDNNTGAVNVGIGVALLVLMVGIMNR